MTTPPPAGWYDDSTMANTRRYWDGERWTDHRQEKAPAAAPVPPVVAQAEPPSDAVTTWGTLFAIFLPIVGFFIGLAILNKQGNTGIKMIGISVVAGIIYIFIGVSVHNENVKDDCVTENIYREGTGLPQLDCG